jgi:Mrp family chromosome partitioning ATPase/capsular polysaccharide biosynthesis protein
MAVRQFREPDDFAAEPRSMDLREYWLIMRRRWVTVVTVAVIGIVGGAGYFVAAKPSYEATAQVVVVPLQAGNASTPSQLNLILNMSTEQGLAQSAAVATQAAHVLGMPAAELVAKASSRLTVAVPTTSDLLQITWKAGSARSAQAGANAFAIGYIRYRHGELVSQVAATEAPWHAQATAAQRSIARLTSQINGLPVGSSQRASVQAKVGQLNSQLTKANDQLAQLAAYNTTGGNVISAPLPLGPSGLGKTTILAISAILGLLIGMCVAFMRDVFDDRVRDPGQLERKLGAPTLAVLPTGEDQLGPADDERGAVQRRRRAVATVAEPGGRAAEGMRTLRSTLIAVAARTDRRTLLVVSADASVSSGRIAAELGVSLAESGRRVLMVAADIRGSALPPIFEVPNTTGLGDLLVKGGDPETVTRQPRQVGGTLLPGSIYKRLAILPSGIQNAQVLSALDSAAMTTLLSGQREAYEFVVLDSPPATIAGDIVALATQVDGVIVVGRAVRTRGKAVAELRRQLDQVGATIIGGVLIAKGRPGQGHRRQAGAPAPVPPRPVPPRPVPPRSGPGPGSASPSFPDSPKYPSGSEPRPDGPPAGLYPPETRPLPAIRDDAAPRDSGSLAKRRQ